MGFMKGQHPECVLEFLGHPNVAFVLDKHSRFIPGLGVDNVVQDAPSGALVCTAALLLPSSRSDRARGPSIGNR